MYCCSSPLFVMAPRFLVGLLLLSHSNGVFSSKGSIDEHRIFPAAQKEVYYDDINRIGIIHPAQLQINVTGPADSQVGSVLERSIARFRGYFGRLPDFFEDYPVNPLNQHLLAFQSVEVEVRSPELRLNHGVDESYWIGIDRASDFISMQSATVFGAMRGLETLAQLFEFGWTEEGEQHVFVVRSVPLSIKDSPAFPYRGLMIDTSRHFLPMDLIMDNLDAMAMNKLNVLHWHITDSQSFPFQAPSYPDLSRKGAYHPKRIYTPKDIQSVVKAAYFRGIRVIPELDMPGHTDAIARARPDLMAHCPEPSEPLDPTNPDVYDFVQGIYQDLGSLFLDDFVHVGGDEVAFDCWSNSTNIAEWMKTHNMTDTVQLYEYFEQKLLDVVSNRLNKTAIVWQEVFNLNLTLSNDSVVDVWKGFDRETIEQAISQNRRVIVSGCWYLDHLGDTWETYYKCDPRNVTGNRDLVIGGHASMWGELVDASNFMSRVWPRASSAAERLWTGNVTDIKADKSIHERIHQWRCRMVQQGIPAGPTRPGSCPTEFKYPTRSSKTEHLSPLTASRPPAGAAAST